MKQISILSGLTNEAQKALTKKVNELFGASDGFLEYLQEISLSIWANTAIEENKSWGPMYASALRKSKSGDVARVYVDESDSRYKFVEMMEEGVKPWSIRDALLNSKKVRYSKTGARYIAVPFRWKTPTQQGGEKPLSSFAGNIPRDVYQIVKAGGRLGGGWGNLSGLKRYGSEKHSQYMTFRMVSDNTPTSKWQHPGKRATPVYDKVYPMIIDKVNQSLEDMGVKMAGSI